MDVLKADFLSALHTDGAAGLRRLTFLIELRGEDRDLDVGLFFLTSSALAVIT